MSTLYFLVDVATVQVVADAAPLPAHLAGLTDETLRDLTPLASQVPQFNGLGFWPQHVHECADVTERTLVPDAELGVVVDKLPCGPVPALDYVAQRRDTPFPAGYGTVAEQLDLQFHAGTDGWAAHIAEVKARFPKSDAADA